MSVLKPVKPYLTYAAQLRNSVPVMAYHCKLYAVQQGLDLCKKTPGEQANAAKSYLIKELDDLTAMKNSMGDINKEDMKIAIENFVLSVFASSDKDERTCEQVGQSQAIAFKRSGAFIQVLTLFGALSEEWEERRKYCIYKAGTIMKALKNGEVPPRGNPFAPEPEPVVEEQKQPVNDQGMPEPVNFNIYGGNEMGNSGEHITPGNYGADLNHSQMLPNTGYSQPLPTSFGNNSLQQPPFQQTQTQYQQPTYQQPAYQPQQQQQFYQQPQYQQPSYQAGQIQYIPQTPGPKDQSYYKGIQSSKKDLVQTQKEIKCMHIDAAVKNLRNVLNTLQPFAAQRCTGLPANGDQPRGGQFNSDLAKVGLFIENAMGELDYTKVENAYVQIVQAIATLSPYAK